jgi:hypothetical protein
MQTEDQLVLVGQRGWGLIQCGLGDSIPVCGLVGSVMVLEVGKWGEIAGQSAKGSTYGSGIAENYLKK